jgi:hypothetical protein
MGASTSSDTSMTNEIKVHFSTENERSTKWQGAVTTTIYCHRGHQTSKTHTKPIHQQEERCQIIQDVPSRESTISRTPWSFEPNRGQYLIDCWSSIPISDLNLIDSRDTTKGDGSISWKIDQLHGVNRWVHVALQVFDRETWEWALPVPSSADVNLENKDGIHQWGVRHRICNGLPM